MAEFLLTVPLKLGYETDAGKLTQILKTEFAGEGYKKDSGSVTHGITQLINLRNQIVQTNTLPKTQVTLELFYRYHDQLAALIERLPKLKLLYSNMALCWEDAFEKGGLFGRKTNMTTPFLEVERLCVMFNIAAIQTHLGTQCRAADTDDELKNATKFYQNAATIFNHMITQIKELPTTASDTLSPDLSSDSLTALKSLLLAQAQAVFIEKATRDKMKDGIIAKLCIHAHDMYTTTLAQLSSDSVKNLWDKNCISNVSGTVLAYEAMANYFQAKVCASKKQYGEQIGRLDLTIKNLKKAQSKLGNPNYLSNILSEAEDQVKSAKRDNDFIYHEVVPSPDALAQIERVDSARLAKLNSDIPPRFSTEFVDLFESAEKGNSGEAGSLKQIFNTAAHSLGNYLINKSGKK